ncbi:FxLD family lanthipeptide [Frankia sp. CiP3]|uniref:FxLD family lanthipeptide n=1 Tax=Frankia sp. CiP3 TaxID=2880971 RepID=UPI001EF3E3F5|nr:FxLD family lanthipeptide [Frankia sp. CiP3]
MTPPSAVLAPSATSSDLDPFDVDLDLRVIEAVGPLVITMCATDDNCGSTCKPSACSTSSDNPS